MDKVKVPNVWNLGDSVERVDERRDRLVPQGLRAPDADSALAWAFRFESVNYRAKVWLNGKPIGENTGAYVPVRAQPSGFKRRGTNRLVVRVDSKRRVTDFPPAGLNTDGVPTGGWWNYSGIQREVYLRKIDTVDFRKVLVRPCSPCGTCDATIQARINLKNVTRRGQRVDDHGQVRQTRTCGWGRRRSARTGSWSSRTTSRSATRACGRRGSPNLYDVSFTVRVDGQKVAGYELKSGIRSIKVSNGRLILNGQALNTRGLGLHEDSKAQGFAIDNARREELLNQAKELGATLDPHALPVAPVHARAGRPHGHPDLVGDPGLHGQDRRCSRSRSCGGWRSRSCAATSRPTRTTRR